MALALRANPFCQGLDELFVQNADKQASRIWTQFIALATHKLARNSRLGNHGRFLNGRSANLHQSAVRTL
jgi:hypothetical protein